MMGNNGLKRTAICMAVVLSAFFAAHIPTSENGLVANGAGDRAHSVGMPARIAQPPVVSGGQFKGAEALDAQEVMATIKRVADWQLANAAPYDPQHWAMAPLYDGLIDTSLTIGDPQYLASVIRAGRQIAWQPGPRVYHADDHAAGHAWLRIYLMDPTNPELLQPFKDRFDEILAKPIDEDLSFTEKPQTPGVERTDRWTWSDALYMAPPTLGRLSQATGDECYLKFTDTEFKAAYESLFDPEENLFYRDARFIDERTPNGEKVFWSRGNGWVYAGLAELLNAVPADYPNREFYIDVFQQMSPAVLAAQQPDGLWYPSLKDPEHIAIGETSGSALFLFGVAWGVRQGLLDHDTYWPAVERGWNALLTRISPNGAVGYVQPIGADPESFTSESSEPYGTGAVLGAGSEILRALGADGAVDPAKLRKEAEERSAEAPDLSSVAPTLSTRVAPAFSREISNVFPQAATGADERAYSVEVLTRIAFPVLDALSKGELKERMPVHEWERHRAAFTHYEAFARTLAGIAPWLELGPDDTPEGQLRARFINLARQSLITATDPQSPDFMNFGDVEGRQPLVEAAYLASALLSAPTQLWEPLNEVQRENVLDALRASRPIEPGVNNWVLFSAMVEAALWEFDGDFDIEPIEYGVSSIESWYLGDGTYGDGPRFVWNYYNSYVMHPMLLQVLRVAEENNHPIADESLGVAMPRAMRYAEVLERLISPEGTFPVMGRSSAYRFAAFYHLAYMALIRDLPPGLEHGAVRGGITAVVQNMVEAPGTFDEEGWLQLGAVGSQPGLQEDYNATGSLYVALTGLVHLGLPPEDPFWTAPDAPWTQQRIWAGENVPRDDALE